MRLALPLLALASVLVGTGCSDTMTARYEPRTAVQPKTLAARRAVRFYEGDIETLAKAGGTPIGTINLTASNNWHYAENDEFHAEVAEAAAKRGGTHFFYLAPDIREGSVATVNRAFGTTWVSARQTRELKGASYLVVRVEPEAWEELPEQLRPKKPKPKVPAKE